MATYCTRIYVKVAKQDLMEELRALDISDIGKGFYQAKDIFASPSAECTFQDGESAINESDLQTLVARVVEVIRGQGTILAETWSYDYDPFPQVCYYNGDEIVSKLLDMDGAELKETVNINDVSAWIDFVENADEYETDEDGMVDDDQDALASLPRFICDTDTINQLASAEPNITRCDPNLTFVMDYTDEPVTVLFASATDEVKKIAGQLQGVEMDDEADAYILFFRRTTFPVNAFSVGMIAYAAVNWKTKGIKGGSSNERINRYFGPVVGAMLRMNIWLQQDDTYECYQKLNGETSAMLVTANEGEITACVVQGKERPNMQCENLFNMQTLFAGEPEVVSARPYRDEIFNIWNREMMSIEEKTERAEAGDTDCMEELAMQYLNGDDDVKAEPEKALYWFRKLAEAGHPNGMFNLGLFYAKGFCVPRDFKLAAEWMRKAEAAGDDDATALVEMYTSMMEAEAKAKQGNAEAQAVLAKGLMQLGNSLEQAGSGNDYKESVEWAQKAAAQGNAAAMWVLALAHHHGRGVKQKMDLAIAYYKKGADMGNADCMHNLGCEYLSGEHLWKNAKKGFELVKRAAEMGNGLAMYNLGRAYQFGNGCIGNMKKALEWYEKAAEVLHDPQIEQRVMAFRSLSEFQPDFDEDYSGEEDPCEDVPLERTQYEGRADRCERLRPGTVLEYRFAKDQNNQPVLEMFYQGGSVGVISHFASEKIIEFLKKDRITLKVIVKSCIPKSQRGARARSADVKLTLEIDDKIPGVPVEVAEHPTKKPDVERKKEEARACKEPEKNEKGAKEMANVTRADRIEFGPFFSVEPENGLMVADHKKADYEEGDIVAEIINTSFGREPELSFFGGFENGIDIKVNKLVELDTDRFAQLAENMKNDDEHEIITARPDIFVSMMSVTAGTERAEVYIVVTEKGILSAAVNLGIMSKAEADSYRKMFASALPIGAAAPASSPAPAKPTPAPAKPTKPTPPPDPEADKKRAERAMSNRISRFNNEACSNLKQKAASASAEKIRSQLVALLEEPLKAAQEHQRSQAQQLSVASFFAFGLKKKLKQAIADDDVKIAKLKEHVQAARTLNDDAAVAMAYFIEHSGKSWDDFEESDLKFANSSSGRNGYYGMVVTLKELELVKEDRSSGWNAKTIHTFDKRLSFAWPKPSQSDINAEALRLLYSSMGGDTGTSPAKMREDIRNALLKDINAKALPGKHYTPTKGEMEALKEAVYDAVLCYGPANASELCQRDRNLADVSSMKVSSLLRQLMLEGRIVRNGTRYETV